MILPLFQLLLFASLLTTKLQLGHSLVLHHSVILAKSQPAHGDIVLLHGLLGSSRNFRTFASLVYQRFAGEMNIIVIDSRNHGRTVASGRGFQIAYDHCARDCIDTFEFLKLESAHIIGIPDISLYLRRDSLIIQYDDPSRL